MTTPEQVQIFALRRALAVAINSYATYANGSVDAIKASLIEALDLYVTQNPSATTSHQASIELATAEILAVRAW